MFCIQNMESITSFGHKWIILSYLNGEQKSVQWEKGEKRNKLFNQYCPCLPCFTVTTNIRNWTEPSSQLGESA